MLESNFSAFSKLNILRGGSDKAIPSLHLGRLMCGASLLYSVEAAGPGGCCLSAQAVGRLRPYRHGLRASELVDLRWAQVDFATATLHVRRVKLGTPSTHPILGDELRALQRLQRDQEPKSPFAFTSERGVPFSTAGFARMVERARIEAKFGFKPAPAHAQARLRLRAGQQGTRHTRPASLTNVFTDDLADAASVELVLYTNGNPAPSDQQHLMEDFKPGAKPRPDCALCGDVGYWGRGDVEPLLGRS
jgi:hypothetical protein